LILGYLELSKLKIGKLFIIPCEKIKSSNIFGQKKTTIKSLFQKEQIPKKLPSLNNQGSFLQQTALLTNQCQRSLKKAKATTRHVKEYAKSLNS
jgi:hypothetical protein